MSRAHMLYDNKALSTLPVKVTNWKDKWVAEQVFKVKSGCGLIIEARLICRTRHTIIDVNNSKYRYVCFYIEVLKSCKRQFDVHGKEIEPDYGSQKKVNTGYLSSSYKTVAKEGVDILTPSQTTELLKLSLLDSLVKEKLNELNKLNLTCVWCAENEMEGIEIEDQDHVRIRTKGSGPYLESITSLSSDKEHLTNKVNYTTGESVGGSWTDKVLNNKDTKTTSHLTEDSIAVEDDEWDD